MNASQAVQVSEFIFHLRQHLSKRIPLVHLLPLRQRRAMNFPIGRTNGQNGALLVCNISVKATYLPCLRYVRDSPIRSSPTEDPNTILNNSTMCGEGEDLIHP